MIQIRPNTNLFPCILWTIVCVVLVFDYAEDAYASGLETNPKIKSSTVTIPPKKAKKAVFFFKLKKNL